MVDQLMQNESGLKAENRLNSLHADGGGVLSGWVFLIGGVLSGGFLSGGVMSSAILSGGVMSAHQTSYGSSLNISYRPNLNILYRLT